MKVSSIGCGSLGALLVRNIKAARVVGGLDPRDLKLVSIETTFSRLFLICIHTPKAASAQG